MIEFIECQKSGYPARTEENIRNSDVTLAFAIDFNSAGEKLTKKLCNNLGKVYVPIDLTAGNISEDRVKNIAMHISTNLKQRSWSSNIRLNIAGNGIYSLPNTQKHYNDKMEDFILNLINIAEPLYFTIIAGYGGGQTGIDEAGAIAMNNAGIPTTVIAPKGWKFRGKDNIDTSDETLFKQRFLT